MTDRTPRPRTSVIITSYNYARYLSTAMASVLAQTDRDFELIVVDDDSSDDSLALARGCADPRVRVMAQPHRGLGAARNTGIGAARGRYIAFLDADDVWAPDKLRRQCEILERQPDVGLVYTRFGIIDAEGRRQSRGYHYLSVTPSGAVLPHLVRGNVVGTPSTICFRRDLVLTREVYFDETDTHIEDWHFYLRLAPHCAFSYLARTLAFHRQHGANMQRVLAKRMSQSLNTAGVALTQARQYLDAKDDELRRMNCRLEAYIDAMAGRECVKAGHFQLARAHAARSLRRYPWSVTEAVVYVCASLGWVPWSITRHLK
jgi:glycosyltransferase involved in cell wall biosynthesis